MVGDDCRGHAPGLDPHRALPARPTPACLLRPSRRRAAALMRSVALGGHSVSAYQKTSGGALPTRTAKQTGRDARSRALRVAILLKLFYYVFSTTRFSSTDVPGSLAVLSHTTSVVSGPRGWLRIGEEPSSADRRRGSSGRWLRRCLRLLQTSACTRYSHASQGTHRQPLQSKFSVVGEPAVMVSSLSRLTLWRSWSVTLADSETSLPLS